MDCNASPLARNISYKLLSNKHSFRFNVGLGLWGGAVVYGFGVLGRAFHTLLITSAVTAINYSSFFRGSLANIMGSSARGVTASHTTFCRLANVLRRVRQINSNCFVSGRLHNSLLARAHRSARRLHSVRFFSTSAAGDFLGRHGCCTLIGGYGFCVSHVSENIFKIGDSALISTTGAVHT